MYSYHTLMLLAEAHRDDLMREAHPQPRSVAPKRKIRGLLGVDRLRLPIRQGVAVWSRLPRRHYTRTGNPGSLRPQPEPLEPNKRRRVPGNAS